MADLERRARRGGLVAGLNEGTRALGANKDAPGQQSEKEFGINEHVHTVWTYAWSFVRAGLIIRRAEHSAGNSGRATKALAHAPKLGSTLGALVDVSTEEYSGVSIFARRRR